MRKTIIILALLAILLIPNTIALASTSIDSTIADSISQHNNVKSSVAVVYEDKCIIAIQPQGIVTRTDYESLVQELTAKVTAEYPEITHCHVTRSVKAYRMIDKINALSDTEKQNAIADMIDKIEHHHMTMPHIEPTA